jgi:glycosyltransferase involved in cell wall biosynthesis
MKNKMKIIYIFPQHVIPPSDGGKQSIYYPLMSFSKIYDIYGIVISDLQENVIKEEYLAIGLQDILIIKQDKKDRIISIINNIFQDLPFKWAKYISKKNLKLSISYAKNIQPDLILCSAPHIVFYGLKIKDKLNIPLILREHNIEYELVKQYCKLNKIIIIKGISFWQYKKTYKKELKYWEQCDMVVFISNSDYEIANKIKRDLSYKFRIVYDGFELKNSSLISLEGKEPNSFIITAPIKSSLQNVYNIKHFINNIWKPLIKNNKSYTLYLTGNTADDLKKYINVTLKELQDMNIIPLGFIENIEEVIRKKKYFISPTFFGSGIRLKVLQALSLGMPIFLTIKDYETVTYFKDMENVILFNDFADFESKLREIENNPVLYNTISNKATELAIKELNWNIYVKKFSEIIDMIINKR